jgi:hypothetical protein
MDFLLLVDRLGHTQISRFTQKAAWFFNHLKQDDKQQASRRQHIERLNRMI